jgi:hypothetical protein
MSFKKEDISDAITCSICSDIYLDPRILPCGETVCEPCIKVETECHFCKKVHFAPHNGFPKNAAIQKLIIKDAEFACQNRILEQLRSKLAKIKEKNNEIKENIDSGTDEIKKHCENLRAEVRKKAESTIDKIMELTETLAYDIDQYESECLNSYNVQEPPRDHRKGKRLQFTTELDDFCADKTLYLNSLKIDYDEIERLLSLSDDYLARLKKEERSLQTEKFGNKFIHFKPCEVHLPQNHLLGELVSKKLFDFKSKESKTVLVSHKIKQLLKCVPVYSSYLFKLEKSSNIIFYSAKNRLNMIEIDNDGKETSRVHNILNDIHFSHWKVIHIQDKFIFKINLSSDITVVLNANKRLSFISNENYTKPPTSILLLVTNTSLEYIKHECFPITVLPQAANRTHLLMTSSTEKLMCYDLNFRQVTSVDLADLFARLDMTDHQNRCLNLNSKYGSVPTYSQYGLPVTVTSATSTCSGISDIKIEMNDSFVFLLSQKHGLKVLRFDNLSLVREIDVGLGGSLQMKCIMNDYLAIFNAYNRTLCFYDIAEGFEKVDEVKVNASEYGLEMSTDKTEFVSFKAPDLSKFYYFD